MMFIHCPKDGPILRWLLHTSYAAERKGGTSGKPVAKLIGRPALQRRRACNNTQHQVQVAYRPAERLRWMEDPISYKPKMIQTQIGHAKRPPLCATSQAAAPPHHEHHGRSLPMLRRACAGLPESSCDGAKPPLLHLRW